MTAAVLGLAFVAGCGASWMIAYGAGFRASERMWDAEWTARQRQLFGGPPAPAEAPAAKEKPEPADWPIGWRIVWPVLVFVANFWHTPIGERIDRAAVWLGRYEPSWVQERPAPRHVVNALPAWAMPTGGWEAVLASRVDEERIRREQLLDEEIAALVEAQTVGVSHA